MSLFGYPGAGHFLVGQKRQGIAYAALFTLTTLGVVYELWELLPELLKLMKQMVDMQEAFTIPSMPNLPRMALWIVLSTGFWVAAAVHAAILANALPKPIDEEATLETASPTEASNPKL